MIQFEKYQLKNGLTVILSEDLSTPLVAVNILYKVGSKNDDPSRTGYAHLFEHLMFEGASNIANFDEILQNAGGESNAFTNQDITNYYNLLPAINLDTVLEIEAERMFQLKLSKEKVDIQKKVVIEEFAETCINEPFGMVWHELMELCYQDHGYRWPTIGLIPEHISTASFENINAYHNWYYHPSNAILTICGGITIKEMSIMVDKYFNREHSSYQPITTAIVESNLLRNNRVTKDSTEPVSAIYMAFHTPARNHPEYYISDMISDILSNGRSSLLYQSLIMQDPTFAEIDAYVTGTTDSGLLIIEGKILDGVTVEKAEKGIWNILDLLKNKMIDASLLEKYVNKAETGLSFAETSVMNVAMNLGFFEYIDDAEAINEQVSFYERIIPQDIIDKSSEWLTQENCITLIYE